MGIKKDTRVTWRALEEEGVKKAVVRWGGERGRLGGVLGAKRARRGLFCLSFEKKGSILSKLPTF